MDETDNNEGRPQQSLSSADQDVLKSEGVEIMSGAQTLADKNSALQDEIARVAPAIAKIENNPPVEKLEKMGSDFSEITKSFSQNPNGIKPIRTYRSDAEEAVGRNKTSVIDIAVAESKRKEQTPIQYQQEKKSGWLLWFSLIFIFIAIAVAGGTYYFWSVGSGSVTQTTESHYPSLIQTQKTETIAIDTKNPLQSLSVGIKNISSVPVGSMVDLIPIETNGIAIATSTDFFAALGIALPIQVRLSLNDTYTLGAIISNPNRPFIVLGLSSFENAFAGMLGWEKTMHNDLAGFIQIEHPGEPSVALVPEKFVDKTIANQDVRELVDASSTPLLLYSFINTTRLVITTDADTMSSIINSLNTTNTTR